METDKATRTTGIPVPMRVFVEIEPFPWKRSIWGDSGLVEELTGKEMTPPIGARIREAREKAHADGQPVEVSQTLLGELCGGVSGSSISEYERGTQRPPAEVVAAIAWVLNVSADWLTGLIDKPRALVEDAGPFNIAATRVYLDGEPPASAQIVPFHWPARRKTSPRRVLNTASG